MTDFIAHVMEEGKPSNSFRHEFQAKDYAEAIEFARTGIVQAYKDEKKTEARNTIIVLLLLNFDVPPKAWRLKMPSEEIEECEVPCGYCGGAGGMDSGGVDPQGHGIDIPCPSCSPTPPAEERSYKEALNSLQDEVWASLGKYSEKLGWGLTGIQPECWTMLDMSVDELKDRRKVMDDLRRIVGIKDGESLTNAVQLLKDLYASSQNPRA